MKRPANWLRVQRHQPPTSFPPPSAAPLAASEWGMQWRCFFWMVCVCLFDAKAPAMVLILGISIAFELWALTRSAQPSQRMRAMWRRLYSPPPQLVFFAVMMLLNVALQERLTEAASRPYAANFVVLHAVILIWAYVSTPSSRIARQSLHFWASSFIIGLSLLLLVQIIAKQVFDVTVDFREMLTGEPSRSGIEEGTSGLRPTTLFEEPSNHAIVIFLLTFIARITGPRSSWLTAVSTFSCLFNNSGIGLILTAFLVLEEISYQATARRVGLPLILGCAAVLVLLLIGLEASNYKVMAWERIIRPQNRYDPVAVRLFVPNAILHFEPIDHLIGSGISNYASFKDGVTLSDSTFVLGVYYQIGMLGLVMVLSTLRSAWLVHSPRAAAMLLMLFMTKMGLTSPIFWALTALLVRGVAITPVTRKVRPVRLVTFRVLSKVTLRLREVLDRWARTAKSLVLMTVLPSDRAMPQSASVGVGVGTPFQDTQPVHFETTFFAPDSHSEPFPRRSSSPARHARRPHHSQLARRRC
jgi:hypothetical protein